MNRDIHFPKSEKLEMFLNSEIFEYKAMNDHFDDAMEWIYCYEEDRCNEWREIAMNYISENKIRKDFSENPEIVLEVYEDDSEGIFFKELIGNCSSAHEFFWNAISSEEFLKEFEI